MSSIWGWRRTDRWHDWEERETLISMTQSDGYSGLPECDSVSLVSDILEQNQVPPSGYAKKKPWLWNRPLKMTALLSFETSGTTRPATQRHSWKDPNVSLTPFWWCHVRIFVSAQRPYRLFTIPSLRSVGCPRVSGVERTKIWSDLSPSYSGVHHRL